MSATGIVINIRESSMADSKLQALTQRIVDVQEEERSRVARELHDGISQILVSTKYSLEAVSMGNNGLNGQGTKALANAIVRITSAIHETRRISHDLRPGILDDLGLSTALKNLVEEFADRNGLEAEISTVAFKNTMRNDVKTGLYRVAQEALTNIERHTKATKISVRLAVEKENIVMEIKDNGSGFDPNAIRINGNQSHGI